jgi:signal-transduction protein with cAMP-binding, CBS, and nucleotidyltransferase domain
MAKMRKGVLVMKGKELQGIITPKDLLNRVIAKGLSPDDTLVSDVMTPNPDCVSPDLTLIDALREMHDHKYLHLPVREANGRVVGLVDVMELVKSTAGEGEGGGKGWRSFFDGMMTARGDRDVSDTASNDSARVSVAHSRATASRTKGAPSSDEKAKLDRPVSKLRPKTPVTVVESSSIFDVAIKMAASRVDAALLIGQRGDLAGIITDNDITRRVISESVDPSSTKVRDVMTKKPKCVSMDDSALDALEMMVDNRFRHLPVLDKDGVIVGLLDIAKCLYDAISILEKVHDDKPESEVLTEAMTTAMKHLTKLM